MLRVKFFQKYLQNKIKHTIPTNSTPNVLVAFSGLKIRKLNDVDIQSITSHLLDTHL